MASVCGVLSVRETHNLWVTDRIRDVAEFLLIEAFFYFLLPSTLLLFVEFSLVLAKRRFAFVSISCNVRFQLYCNKCIAIVSVSNLFAFTYCVFTNASVVLFLESTFLNTTRK